MEQFDHWVNDLDECAPAALRSGSPLLDRLRRLQPYQWSDSPWEHPLALLADYSGHIRHRLPSVAELRLAAISADQLSLDPRVTIPDPLEGPVRVGDVVAEVPRGVAVPISPYPTVGLNRPGTQQWPLLVKELEHLASWVRTQAIPILTTGRAGLDSLPVSYDCNVGHADDRAAIRGGTDTSAANRYTRRLSAVLARQELVELLQSHPAGPDRGLVAQWVASLKDAAVLDRVRRLTAGQSPAQIVRMLGVLDDMFGEIQGFRRALG